MSAAVCGKRPFIDDQLYNNSPPTPSSPSNKRLRRFSPTPPRPTSSAAEERERFASRLDHLRSLFPGMDAQILENTFEACGYDLDSTIKKLNELWLGSAEANLASDASEFDSGNGGDGHLTSQTRATRALEALEKSILARASTEAAESFQKEYTNLKNQVETLLRDNNILKRAVTIQHERQKNYDERNQEVQHLRQLVSQYQEQLRALEVNNYSLSFHLKQAQQSSSIPGRFHPDVF
ncbi:hypothetical protein QJS10_CPA02g00245 [Acorus calamus]|uniref:CUE domain-containing protein n=1 Tax=Acorus calamus TaxID=4465 RepID=A0AAV9FG54_ACOCL|nr:hypothetical protein QJS10_CPA02g00245 [Acorus calamus]